MVVRVFATVCWIGIAGIGVHMMREPSVYEQWASVAYEGDGSFQPVIEFSKSLVESLGGINTGRVLTIMGSFMIVGTWIKQVKRKKESTITGRQEFARGDEKILLGDAPEDPVYEI
jgi:hypothetical protein